MNYEIYGKVIKGDGYGAKIGFPTINLDRKNFSRLINKPAFGVYAGSVSISGKEYKAGIVIGPFDKKKLPKIEAYLLGYQGNAYGKNATFNLRKFIREFKKFKTEKELVRQIEKDLKKC